MNNTFTSNWGTGITEPSTTTLPTYNTGPGTVPDETCYNWSRSTVEWNRVAIKFKKVHPDAILPKANNNAKNVGDSGYDLYSVEPAVIKARGFTVVPVGILLADITPGFWFRIEPRSGLGFNHNLQPHLGVIDNCVPAETLIQTVDGQVTAGELYNMDIHPNIISYNIESNSVDIDKITEMWEVENSELIEIETETGCVKIPPHKTVYTKRGWVAAKDLNTNDYILEYC
jgi:small nuclear ribonucleoprotein (snRNP)-like protein